MCAMHVLISVACVCGGSTMSLLTALDIYILSRVSPLSSSVWLGCLANALQTSACLSLPCAGGLEENKFHSQDFHICAGSQNSGPCT